jgi:hypothetical protein
MAFIDPMKNDIIILTIKNAAPNIVAFAFTSRSMGTEEKHIVNVFDAVKFTRQWSF